MSSQSTRSMPMCLRWALPMVGGSGGPSATASVAALVRVSGLPASSLKETITFMVFPISAEVSLWLAPVAPSMSTSSASHW